MQTGSGKTHTMLGDIVDLEHQPSDDRGMTPRVFEYLFSKIQEVSRGISDNCMFLSFFEVTSAFSPSNQGVETLVFLNLRGCNCRKKNRGQTSI